MGTKVTVSVEDGADHSVIANINATTTGQTYSTEQIDAGGEKVFDLGEEQRVVIDRGPATEQAEDSTKKKK